MKSIIGLVILSFPFIVGCGSTAGSRDSANIPAYASPTIAQSMTRELTTYPVKGVISPVGKPIYNAFSEEFEALGWGIIPSDRKETYDEEMQRGNIRIFTRSINHNVDLVRLTTPYFDVSQTFLLNKKKQTVKALSNPTIREKTYEQ